MKFLDIRDERVQEFLWTHIVPHQTNSPTKGDAFTFLFDEVLHKRQWLAGDLDAGLVFRAHLRNPVVLEVHIMGNAMHLRGLLPAALDFTWSQKWSDRPIQRLAIFTLFEPMVSILARYGFNHEASIAKGHWDGEKLTPIHILSMENPNAAEA